MITRIRLSKGGHPHKRDVALGAARRVNGGHLDIIKRPQIRPVLFRLDWSKRASTIQSSLIRTSELVVGALLLILTLVSAPALAQLNQNCTVSVLNRNVQVKADGTWVLPNIPANFGRVRARATCVQNGVTSYGQTDYFTVPANGSVTLPPMILGSASAIPTSVTLTAPTATLTSPGATLQLGVTASYADGHSANISPSSAGTSYSISNPAIATISPEGLVTAMRSGTVMIQAINEGAQGILMLRVAFAAADSDGDGITDEEEIRLGMNPNNPADALLDEDHDGLTALEEYQRGTNPRNSDTDGDGISDGDEVHGTLGFITNPLLADTDGDGITDKTEIQTGSNPTNASSVNLAQALTGIQVNPANFTLTVNSIIGEASVQLSVIGTLIDGRTINLNSTQRGTSYASSNLANCNFGSPDGRVFASAVGSCTITVSNNGFTAVSTGRVQSFNPTALSYVTIPGFANDVAVSADYAYVAAGSGGLKIVALSADRRTPSIASSLNLPGNANAVTLVGNRAYVAAGSAGLHIIDITNPLVPRLLGSFATGGNAMGVKVVGTVAFVASGSNLQIVNVSNPAAMITVSTLSIGGTVWNLDIDPSRNLALVAAGISGVRAVDISNVAAPVLRGQVLTGDARGVAMRGNYAYVADYNNSMTSIDITNLNAPTLLSSTPLNLGGRLQGVVLSGNFAMGADVLFVNGVPIVDISDPTVLRPRTILNFTDRDDNGMGIAVDGSFVYLAADRSSLNRGGSSGDSRLYIGQFQPRVDLAGVAPTAIITTPTNGAMVFEGEQITLSVNAVDDVAVAAVQFLIDGHPVFTTTSAPYQYTFMVPTGVNSLRLGAEAADLGGNIGDATGIIVIVMPDPLTVVTGLLVDTNNTPLSGATVTAPGGHTGVTGPNGRFSIVGVPTVLGDIFVSATFAATGGTLLTGTSTSLVPVRGGTTDVGTTTLISAQFETNYGTYLSNCDDCSFQRSLPFSFPYYGVSYTNTFVGTNGYLTFNTGDSTFTENVPSFTSRPRISAFFDDLYGARSTVGAVYVNDQLPGRFIVTHDRVPHFSFGGSNTMQIQLFQDGRIIFAYKGITSLNTGTITGITPGPNAPFQQVDFSTDRNFDALAGEAIYEYFTTTNLFDLDNGFVIFTPNGSGGYNVRTILPTPPAAASLISGGQ